MAMLTREDVLKLATLAKLQLSEQEVEKFRSELSDILAYVEQLSSLDTSDLDPTNQVGGLTNVTRKDELVDYGYTASDLLKNVPQIESDLIRVRRMIG